MRVNLNDLIASANANQTGDGYPPVDAWEPDYCGEMDMVIKSDGTWFHDGTPFARKRLVKLFASILRKDEDGDTYLVTPVEKIKIQVERAHFVAIRVDIEGEGENQRLFFTTNMEDVIEAGSERTLRVETDPETLEPAPFLSVRGRLEASLARPVFYELVNHAVEIETDAGPQLGVYSRGTFFPLGPVGAHKVD